MRQASPTLKMQELTSTELLPRTCLLGALPLHACPSAWMNHRQERQRIELASTKPSFEEAG